MTREERKLRREQWWEDHKTGVVVSTLSFIAVAGVAAYGAIMHNSGFKSGKIIGDAEGYKDGWMHAMYWTERTVPNKHIVKAVHDTVEAFGDGTIPGSEIEAVVRRSMGR